MTLTPDVLSAAASIVSSVVVIFTALAAFRQIAHMRSANEIQAFSAIVERWSAPETAASRDFVLHNAALIGQPDFRRDLAISPVPAPANQIFPVLDLYEEIGTLVNLGIVSERAIMTNYASTILRVWAASEPAIRAMRREQGGRPYRMFEHLASRAQHWTTNDEPRLTAKLETMPDATATDPAARP